MWKKKSGEQIQISVENCVISTLCPFRLIWDSTFWNSTFCLSTYCTYTVFTHHLHTYKCVRLRFYESFWEWVAKTKRFWLIILRKWVKFRVMKVARLRHGFHMHGALTESNLCRINIRLAFLEWFFCFYKWMRCIALQNVEQVSDGSFSFHITGHGLFR